MKQFVRTMLAVMGIAAAAAAMLPSIHAQANASSVVNHGYGGSFGIFDFNNNQFTQIQIVPTSTDEYSFTYQMSGPTPATSGWGMGSIPASSVSVTGSSVNAGNMTLTLNVNTCDVANFMIMFGSCGTFDITFTEIPPKVGGSTITSGSTRTTTLGVGSTNINGHTETVYALLSGTALTYALPMGSATAPLAQMEEFNQVTVTVTK